MNNISWLVVFGVIWAGLLFGGFAFGTLNAEQTHRIPTRARMVSSLALVIAVWGWAAGYDMLPFLVWIAVGMTLGFVGDLLMAGLIIKGDNRVLGGMAAFGLGHVAYIAGIMQRSESMNWGVVAGWWVVAVILWFVIVYRGAAERDIVHYVALPYAILLATTAGMGTSLAMEDSRFILLAVGAALFLISDLILATQLFNGVHFKGIGDVVWLTYGPGQMLIVFTAMLSVR